MTKARTIASALLLLAALTAGAAEAPPASRVSFIVSVKSAVRNLSEGDLRRIFLGQITRWPNGRRVVVFIRPSDSPSGRLFLDRLIRMSDIDYSQWWLGEVFRGRAASAPRVMVSADVMGQAVAANADAIGFAGAVPLAWERELAVITIDGKAPSDRDYPIRTR